MTFKIGITGTRSGASDGQLASLGHLMGSVIVREPTVELHHGDCVGVDIQAAVIASRVGIHTVCHPPVDESLRAHHNSDTILPQLNHFARNRNIVDACNLLIVIPYQDEWQPRGGTWYTHDYAVKKNLSDVATIEQSGMIRWHFGLEWHERTAGKTQQAAGENGSGDIK